MRYDRKIDMVQKVVPNRNYETGEDENGGEIITPLFANVTDLGTDRSIAIFGDIKENAVTVRLLRHYTNPIDYIRIDGTTYKVVRVTRLRQKMTLVCQEVEYEL